jgi:uncharacterized protein (TIGR00369 family)
MNERPWPQNLDAANERIAGVIGSAFPMRYEEYTKERVVVTMEVTPRTHQPMGLLHGGVSLVLAETAASSGGGLNCPPGKMVVGQEINANHIRSKRTGTLRAVAEPLHIGRTSHVWSIEIRDEDGKLVCASRCTLAVVDVPTD